MLKRSSSQGFPAEKYGLKAAVIKNQQILSGNLVKKVEDQRSAKWNGLALDSRGRADCAPKSPIRWKESEAAKRVITNDFIQNDINDARLKTSSSLADLINKGSTGDNHLGHLSKKVFVCGKQVSSNATSMENFMLSSGLSKAYKFTHNGHLREEEKRHKKISKISLEKKCSQISTLPGNFFDIQPAPKSYKLTENSKLIETANPCMSKTQSAYTGNLWFTQVDKKHYTQSGKKLETTVRRIEERKQTGKGKNNEADERMYRGKSPERDFSPSRKPRPISSIDVFASSFAIADLA